MADLLVYFNSKHGQSVESTDLSLFLHAPSNNYSMPFVEEYRLTDVYGTSPQNFGTKYSFMLYNNCDMIGDCYIKLVIPALGGGATNARICDYVVNAIQTVDIYIGGILVTTITAEEIIIYYLRNKSPQQIKAFQNLVAGNLTTTQRINLATQPQTFYIDFIPFWSRSENPSYFLPIRYIAGKNDVRVDITFKDQTQFLNADSGSPTASITTLQLLTQCYYVTDPQRIAIRDLCVKGYDMKIVDTAQKVLGQVLLAGTNSYQIKLTNFRSPTADFYFILRPSSSVTTTYGNQPMNFQFLSTWSLDAAGTTIIKQNIIDSLVNIHIINAQRFPGFDGIPIYGFSWSFEPNNPNSFMGNLDFTNMVNPILTINFSSNLTENYNVDVYSEVPNHIFISADKVFKLFY